PRDEGPSRLQQTAWLRPNHQGIALLRHPWHCDNALPPDDDQPQDRLGNAAPSQQYTPSRLAKRWPQTFRPGLWLHELFCNGQDQPDRYSLVLQPPPAPNRPLPCWDR